MTKTDERLALVERQRRFEWELARDAQTRTAAKFVAGKTHDLLNLVQIVQLASLELSHRAGPDAAEFIADLLKAADDAKDQLTQLMAVARPDVVIVPGAPVGAALTAAVHSVRSASTIPVDLHLTVRSEITTRCTASELEHLVYGLVLDAAPGETADPPSRPGAFDTPSAHATRRDGPSPSPSPGPIELFVRERTIDGKPWLEIVRGARVMIDGEHFDLRAVEAIAVKNGGELAQSERRGGGTEVVVALPLVEPSTPGRS